jgi:hypothetical protein
MDFDPQIETEAVVAQRRQKPGEREARKRDNFVRGLAFCVVCPRMANFAIVSSMKTQHGRERDTQKDPS